jgi:hypothetical protein
VNHSSGGVNFTNGIPSSNDDKFNRKITASHALEENQMNDWENFNNVKRVKQHVSENKFDQFFPIKNDFYTYDGFLKAVGKFPNFCDDFNVEKDDTLNMKNIDEVCKRELATLFAHITFESSLNDPWYAAEPNLAK